MLAAAQAVPRQGQRALWGDLLERRSLWLADTPNFVCEMVWQVVVLAAVWAMEQGRMILRSLFYAPCWYGLILWHAFLKTKPVPVKGWPPTAAVATRYRGQYGCASHLHAALPHSF
jgi:hypothetical protein